MRTSNIAKLIAFMSLLVSAFYSCKDARTDLTGLALQTSAQSLIPYKKEMTNDIAEDLTSILFNKAGTEGWAAGNHGQLFHYANGQWTDTSLGDDLYISSLWMNETLTNGWLITKVNNFINQKNNFYHYKDGHWQPYKIDQEEPSSGSFSKLVMNKAGTIGWALNKFNAPYQWKDGTWQKNAPAKPAQLGYDDICMNEAGTKA